MTDDATPTPGTMDRRSFVRRSAAAGALVWAAPSITSALPAFADTGGSEICVLRVDEYETGSILPLVPGPAGSSATQTIGVTGAISGTRTETVRRSTGTGAVTLEVRTDSEFTSKGFRLDSDAGTKGSAELTYGPGLSYDLTEGGLADRFLVDVVSVVGTVRVTVTVDGVSVASGDLTGSTSLSFPFSSFSGVTFNPVNTVSIKAESVSDDADSVLGTLRLCYIN